MATQIESSKPHRRHGADVFVFGISGATCSGKSAVTDYLCSTQQHTLVLHQDDYYHPDHLIPRTEDSSCTNWDVIGAIDTGKLLDTLKTTIEFPHKSCKNCGGASVVRHEPHITHTVLVEGTMILDVKELYHLLQAVFFITLDYDACKQRRDGRTYPSDVGVYLDPPGYLENVAWPEYLKTLEMASSLANSKDGDDSLTVHLVDGGAKTLADLQSDIAGAITQQISLLRTQLQ